MMYQDWRLQLESVSMCVRVGVSDMQTDGDRQELDRRKRYLLQRHVQILGMEHEVSKAEQIHFM